MSLRRPDTGPPIGIRLNQLGTRVGAHAERMPLRLIALAVFLYSTGPVMVASTSVTGPVFAFWRLWLGVALFAIVTLGYRRLGGKPTSVLGRRWALAAGVVFGVHQLLFMSAIKASSVIDVTLLGTLQPIVVAILAVPMFGERPGPQFRLWSLLAIAGTAVVILAGSAGAGGSAWGMTLSTLNVVAFSIFFVMIKRARDHVTVAPMLLGVMFAAALVVSGWTLVTGPSLAIGRHDLLMALIVAAIPGALGHAFMSWPLRQVAANIPPLFKLAIPLLSGALAWLLLGQAVSTGHLLGGALTIAGVAGALRSPAGRRLLAGEPMTMAAGTDPKNPGENLPDGDQHPEGARGQ
jgi:drug/metabolite transporter (DMT)-like permease